MSVSSRRMMRASERYAKSSTPLALNASYTDIANGGTTPVVVAGALSTGATSYPVNNSYRSEVIWGTINMPYFMLAQGDRILCEYTVQLNEFDTGKDDTWNVLWQLHGHTVNSTNQWPGPPVTLVYENGTFRICGGAAVPTGGTISGQPAGSQAAMELTNQYSEAPTRTPGTDGVKYHWVIDTLLDGPGVGSVNAWCNGQQVASGFKPTAGTYYTAPNGYAHDWLYIKQGVYGGVNTGYSAPTQARSAVFTGVMINRHQPDGTITTYAL